LEKTGTRVWGRELTIWISEIFLLDPKPDTRYPRPLDGTDRKDGIDGIGRIDKWFR
jgi:hypothetical protein